MHYSNQCAGLICCFPFSSQDPRFFGIGLLWSIGNVEKLCLLLGWAFFGRKILLWSERRRQLLKGCHYHPQGPGPENGENWSEAAKGKACWTLRFSTSGGEANERAHIGSRGEFDQTVSDFWTYVWRFCVRFGSKKRLAIADRSEGFFRRLEEFRTSTPFWLILIYWIFCQLTVLSFIDYLSVDSFEFFMILEEKLLILIVKWHLGL